MKRSEMVDTLNDIMPEVLSQDVARLTVYKIMEAIEQAGMLPPKWYTAINGSDCPFQYSHQWEPED